MNLVAGRVPRVVDLTHVLDSEFPSWPGDRPFEMHTLTRAEAVADGTGTAAPRFYANELILHEHSGTHVDAPAHVDPDGLSVERIDAADLLAPLVVVDISTRASANPDTLLTAADLLAWEQVNGRIPDRAIVAMNSGWDERLQVPGSFLNVDAQGIQHTPGFDPDAVRFLVDHRSIVAIGADTLSIDAGRSTTYGAHLTALRAGKYAVEALANLSKVPPRGATVVVGVPKHTEGSGGPARVLAPV